MVKRSPFPLSKTKSMLVYRLVLLFPAFLLLGCATTQDIAKENRTQTFDYPKDKVITATVDAFTAEGYSIESIDRPTGIVNTGTKSNSTMAAAFVGDKSRSVQARVQEANENQSTLLLTIKLETENAFGQSNSQSIGRDAARELYNEWFKRIEQEL